MNEPDLYLHDDGLLYDRPQVLLPLDEDDFALPEKACDLGRPEGCESCQ